MEYNLLASFPEVMSYVGYILLAILVLLVMITVHELGHYIAGKALKFSITEFSIGFGPALFKKRKKDGELFSLRLIPLGGYCSFLGEDEAPESENSFNAKSPWKRIIVLISGALMNYLFALLLIMVMFGAYGQNAIKINTIVNDSGYAYENSLQSGDVLLKVNDRNVYLVTDLMKGLENKSKGELVDFIVLRGGEEKNVKVELRADTDFANLEDINTLCDAIGAFEIDSQNQRINSIYATNVKLGFFATVGRSFEYSFKLAGTVFEVLGQLLTGRIGISSMGGTVTTISVTADAIRLGGVRYLLYIASFIGVNLAVFNLLPIPALDGSRVVFTLIEWIRRKPINKKVEGIIHTVGLVLVFAFAIMCDLQRCF